MGGAVVEFRGVSKRFRLAPAHDSLRDLLAAWFRGRAGGRGQRAATAEEDRSTLWALRDVSFAVDRGEAVGVIGPNGAGKSTALKLLAGILRPDEGAIALRGRLAALIEVGAGFHPDLTGRENVFLNGAILGMTRREIRGKIDAIVAFAGLERFMDVPVKRYSSGMYARLGFSIAAHVDPEVLLVDEALSVGDAVFRLRCMERMHELLRAGSALVFVTHNLDQMQAVCARAVVLEGGRCTFLGTSREAVAQYLQAMSRAYAARPTDVSSDAAELGGAVTLEGLRMLDAAGREIVWARSGEEIGCEVLLRSGREVARAIVELNLRSSLSEPLLSANSGRDGMTFALTPGLNRIVLRLDGLPLATGQYFWNVRVWDADRGTTELDTPFRFPLVLDDGGRSCGAVCVPREWSGPQGGTSPVNPAAEAVGVAGGAA